VFSCIGIGQVVCSEDRLQDGINCVWRGVKLCSLVRMW